jgi:HlyD family secretion protein
MIGKNLALGLAAVALLMVALYSVSAAFNRAGEVSLGEIVTAKVTRGPLTKIVRATGTLEPSELRWLDARVSGRVETIYLKAGQSVDPGTLILEMSNPTLSRNVDTARIDLEVLEAETQVLNKRLTRDSLAQEAVVADITAQYGNAKYRKEANESLAEKGVVSVLDLNDSRLQETNLKTRLGIEQQRLDHLLELNEAEAQANLARMNRARNQLQLQEELLDGLKLRAGIEGILQEVPVEIGQQINESTLLARVAGKDNLLAELRVQESQVSEVALGLPVTISANSYEVAGTVSRIDPAVQNGVVLVDVAFDSSTLPNARPDLRIEGAIEINSIANTLQVSRPVFTRENSTASIFVLSPERDSAVRVPVKLGIGSVDAIQVIEGLHEGDEVIVSDTNSFAEQDDLVLGIN